MNHHQGKLWLKEEGVIKNSYRINWWSRFDDSVPIKQNVTNWD